MTTPAPQDLMNKLLEETYGINPMYDINLTHGKGLIEIFEEFKETQKNNLESNPSFKSQYIIPVESPDIIPVENTINHTQNKFIQIAENVQEERLNICKGCEFYKNESNEPICTQCNCPLKKKVSLVEESCPLKKWLAIKTQSSGGCGCNKK